MTGTALAAAIAGQMPDMFPTTPPPSDTAMEPISGPSPVVLVGAALVAVAVLSFTRRAIEVRSRN